jgi:hypothetical protein
MRPWARRTAMTTLVAVAIAAAGGGLSGTAFAGTDGAGNPGVLSVLGGKGLLAPAGNEQSIPADVCGDASALLGIAVAGCRGGAIAALERHRAVGGDAGRGSSGGVSAGAGTTGAGTTGAGTTGAGTAGARTTGARTKDADTGGPGASSASAGFQSAATSEPGSPTLRQTFGDTLNAPGQGADLADLPSLTGLTGVPVRSDASGSSTLMPTSALSAADASGMSSDSFAALAIGALLAGAAALKIASRRARDRKAGIGATI